MKNKLSAFVVASAAWMMTPTLADEPKTTTDAVRKPPVRGPLEQSHTMNRFNQLGRVERASDLIGAEVKNYQDEKLGKIDELAIDVEGGRVATVIVSIGGFLGLGDTLIAVPPTAFHTEPGGKLVHLDADKTKLKAAPKFEMSKWEESYGQDRLGEVYRYYGQTPYFDARNLSEKNRVTEPVSDPALRSRTPVGDSYTGYTAKASKIIGTSIKNNQDESLGKVENLTVDLAAARVVAVIVSTGGFLGLGDELSAVPPTAFRLNPEHDRLILDATKESLAQAPHFKSSEWPNLGEPVYTESVYRAYRVEPYFRGSAKDVDNTAENIRDRDGRTVTPLDQGNSPADIDTTAQIRKQILADKEMSVNGRNVKIITQNGRVTLRGVVNSDEEKRRIAEIAKTLASENVDNQLQIKGQAK